MTRNEFSKRLPAEHFCPSCRAVLPIKSRAWMLMPYASDEYIAICALECACGTRDVAAVGSNMSAHKAAQALRLQTLKDSGIPVF